MHLDRVLLEQLQGRFDCCTAGPWTAFRLDQKWGAAIEPNTTDQGELGTRHHLVVDARNILLCWACLIIALTFPGANRHDDAMIALSRSLRPHPYAADEAPVRRGRRGCPR